jgi:hypothetical protein
MLPENSDKRNVIGMGVGVTNFELRVINLGQSRLQFHGGRDASLAEPRMEETVTLRR